MTRSRFAVGFLTIALSATWLAAQPPRKEEEEDPPAKAKAKPAVPIPVPVTEPDRKDTTPPATNIGGRMAEELKLAKTAAAQGLFRTLEKPYDLLQNEFRLLRVELLSFRDLPDMAFD